MENSDTVLGGGPPQNTINCPICGREIARDRWGSAGGRFTCSDSCEEKLREITGDEPNEARLLERVKNPLVCVWCSAPLDGKRWDKLFDCDRCRKAAKRRGLDIDKLLRIRRAAIFGGKGQV